MKYEMEVELLINSLAKIRAKFYSEIIEKITFDDVDAMDLIYAKFIAERLDKIINDFDIKKINDKIDFDKYNKIYLNHLRNSAMKWLSEIDPDEWLKEVRGYDDE